MTNIEKAKALIMSFTTGDTTVADEIVLDSYIQHNLAFETGKKGFKSAVTYLGEAPVKTIVETVREFEDEDFVFLQNHYNFAGMGDQVAFDIFRFENGKIAEHWDNLDIVASPNPSNHTQFDGSKEITDLDKTTDNKQLVKNFVYDVLHGKDLSKFTSYFEGDNYIQHNKDIGDGVSGLMLALEEFAKSGIQMVYNKTHMVLGQGNFVLCVSEGSFADQPTSYYDLFRVENGKIAEHWDVVEKISDSSSWKHSNGKF